MSKNTLTFLFVLCATVAFGQKHRVMNNTGFAIISNFGVAGQLSGGDLKQRFGNNFAAYFGLEGMTQKGNWIFGTEIGYLAGKEVKENPISKLYNVSDKIYGGDFQTTDVFLRERGTWFGGYIGKLIPLKANNKRSGIRITVGVGQLRHKIRIQDDTKSIVQFDKPYIYGYDRLTGGFYLSEFVGYQILSPNRRMNFTFGFDFMQGFTKSWRDWDWDLKSKNTTKRMDLLSGFKVAWSLPFYVGENAEEIFY